MNSYTYIASEYKTETDDHALKFIQSVTVTVHAETEEEALDKVKVLIKKKHYYLSSIVEEHTLHDEMQMTSLKMQKKLLDKI